MLSSSEIATQRAPPEDDDKALVIYLNICIFSQLKPKDIIFMPFKVEIQIVFSKFIRISDSTLYRLLRIVA